MTTIATEAAAGAGAGLVVAKINARHMRQAIEDLGLKIDEKRGVEDRARELTAHFVKTTPRVELVECTNCAGRSPAVLDVCPFCAYVGNVSDEDEVKRMSSEDEAKAKKGKKHAGANGIAKAPPSSPTLLAGRASEHDLDVGVEKIHKLKAAGALALWDLGAEIARIYDGGLWMLRLDDKGQKQRWKNVEAFCHAELAMSPNQARELMRVSRSYPRDLVAQFGPKKFALALQAPPDVRPAIVEKIKQGATKRQVEREVREATKDLDVVERGGKLVGKARKQLPEGERADVTSERKREISAKQVTVANLLGTVTVPLFKKASMNPRDPDPKAGARARKVGDEPWGWEELANGVRREYTVSQTPAGELKLRIVTKRADG